MPICPLLSRKGKQVECLGVKCAWFVVSQKLDGPSGCALHVLAYTTKSGKQNRRFVGL